MYSILKLPGLTNAQFQELHTFMQSELMHTRSFYWGKWESGRTGLGVFSYAEILGAKKSKDYGTYTVTVKLLTVSEAVWTASPSDERSFCVQVLAPTYVFPLIMRIVEPRSFEGIRVDSGQSDITVPIIGPSLPYIDLSGLIKLEIEVGLTIRLFRRIGQNAYFEIQRRAGQHFVLSLNEPGEILQDLFWTDKDADLEAVAARLLWKGKRLGLKRSRCYSYPVQEGECADFDITQIG